MQKLPSILLNSRMISVSKTLLKIKITPYSYQITHQVSFIFKQLTVRDFMPVNSRHQGISGKGTFSILLIEIHPLTLKTQKISQNIFSGLK